MRIDEILATAEQPVFSFEFFPPKTDEGERNLRTALQTLAPLEPDFVSVTYGAGGSTRARTVDITRWIKQDLGIEAMSHLTCVGASREELHAVLDLLGTAVLSVPWCCGAAGAVGAAGPAGTEPVVAARGSRWPASCRRGLTLMTSALS